MKSVGALSKRAIYCVGSSPVIRTKKALDCSSAFFLLFLL
nr:MAG TPA: hypothetical protein [Caudoviricetes sp.]